VLVSALTGYGLDTLRAEIAALLSSLWVDLDVNIPYAAGELLARVRERGTVELEYGERDVRVTGRAAPGLAGELTSVSADWARTLASTNGSSGSNGSNGVDEEARTRSRSRG
jgi:50S ribosomal subunit-associated GTPase HflX